MRTRSTSWHTITLAVLAVGCTASHAPIDCPDVLGSCMDRCCRSAGPPSFDEDCDAICPSGTSLIDRCVPGPGCLGCGGVDAGAPPSCTGGPCCDQLVAATQGADCSYSCPAGYGFACEPDPAAFCGPSWLACDVPPDCVLAPVGCCMPCRELVLGDVTAVNVGASAAYLESVCGETPACPPCMPPSAPNLVATCDGGTCRALDVRAHAVSACASDADCRLRVPDCCECGAEVRADDLVAIHVDSGGGYARLVCDLDDPSCDPCGAEYPTSVEAYCGADGHCAVRPSP